MLFALFLLAPVFGAANLCDKLTEVSSEELQLPSEYVHLGLPWVRHRHARVFVSEELTEAWKVVEQYRVRGLKDTFRQVAAFLESKDCLWFAWGGSVRDLLLGKKPSDIDAAITCNPHRLKRICSSHFGEDKCIRPNPSSQKLTIGGEEPLSPGTVDPVDLCHWNATFQVYASHWEFSLNTLSLWVDRRGAEKVYLIDVTGFGLDDACNKRFRIPAKRQHWGEWSREDSSVLKLLRFWKLRLRGFSPLSQDEIDFVVKETMERFDDERFRFFFCHKILDGYQHDDVCTLYGPFKGPDVEKFANLISQDFGKQYYAKRMKPLIRETLDRSNVERHLIENLSI